MGSFLVLASDGLTPGDGSEGVSAARQDLGRWLICLSPTDFYFGLLRTLPVLWDLRAVLAGGEVRS